MVYPAWGFLNYEIAGGLHPPEVSLVATSIHSAHSRFENGTVRRSIYVK